VGKENAKSWLEEAKPDELALKTPVQKGLK